MSTAVAAGNPQQALQECELALAEKPSTFQERLLHAGLLTLSGRLAEARGELLGLLKDFPEHPVVLYAFALLEAQKGKGGAQSYLLEVKGLEKKDLPERRIAVSILEKVGVKDDE